MTELNVKIVQLEPTRATSVYGFGPNPEELAWSKLETWAGPRGYFQDPVRHRIFGFNNPSPTPASPNYGYELWITAGPEVEPEGDLRIVDFAGGLYAVTRLEQINDPNTAIPQGWKDLYAWVEASPYSFAGHQWLEEDHRRPGVTPPGEWSMDLYLPIRE
jgi:DNA gyrase inhibitor GyrI